MNMYALDSMSGMERNLGPKLFAAFYLLSGLGGSIASFLFSPVPSLGASGSVFGMFSATWMYFENNKPYLSRGAKAAQQSIFQTMMINLVLGTFIARVDNWCATPALLCACCERCTAHEQYSHCEVQHGSLSHSNSSFDQPVCIHLWSCCIVCI